MKTKINPIEALIVASKEGRSVSYGDEVCNIGGMFVLSDAPSGIQEKGVMTTVGDVVTAWELKGSNTREYCDKCKGRKTRPFSVMSRHDITNLVLGQGQTPKIITSVATLVDAWDTDPSISTEKEVKAIVFREATAVAVWNLQEPLPPVLPLEMDPTKTSSLSTRAQPPHYAFTVKEDVDSESDTEEPFYTPTFKVHTTRTDELRQRVEQENERYYKTSAQKGGIAMLSSSSGQGIGGLKRGTAPLYPVIAVPSQNLAWQNPSVAISEGNVIPFLLKGVVLQPGTEEAEAASKVTSTGSVHGFDCPLISYGGANYLVCSDPDILLGPDWLNNVCAIILSGTPREEQRLDSVGSVGIKTLLKSVPGFYFAPLLPVGSVAGGGRDMDKKTLLAHVDLSDNRTEEAITLSNEIGANVTPVFPAHSRGDRAARVNESAAKSFWGGVQEWVRRKNRILS